MLINELIAITKIWNDIILLVLFDLLKSKLNLTFEIKMIITILNKVFII